MMSHHSFIIALSLTFQLYLYADSIDFQDGTSSHI
jgi:hypothetical protein